MSSTPGFVYIATTADTKGQELEYVRHLITNLDLPVITLDLSTSGKPSLYHVDVSAHEIAGYHPEGEQAVFVLIAGRRLRPWLSRLSASCSHAVILLHYSVWAGLVAPQSSRPPCNSCPSACQS